MFVFSSGDQSQEALARFGYIRDMKVEKNPKSFSIFGYLLEIIIKI
jgi:hypothetical protein